MWIKICANTSLEDAQLAADAGADAVGFIFAKSPRRMTREQVSKITPYLPGSLETYGLFVDAGFEEIVSAVEDCGFTGVQIHATQDEMLPNRLREYFSKQSRPLVIMRVIHYGQKFDEQLQVMRGNRDIDAVLIDSRTPTAVGGTGIRFDWSAASRSLAAVSSHLRIIAAGGLNPENVAEAIHTLRPWGVDVTTGVEASPGKKDPVKVRAFIAAARAAAIESEKMLIAAKV